MRLAGGRIKEEGRVEVLIPGTAGRNETWGLVCGDGWSLLEAMVICKQLGLGYAQSAPSTGKSKKILELQLKKSKIPQQIL